MRSFSCVAKFLNCDAKIYPTWQDTHWSQNGISALCVYERCSCLHWPLYYVGNLFKLFSMYSTLNDMLTSCNMTLDYLQRYHNYQLEQGQRAILRIVHVFWLHWLCIYLSGSTVGSFHQAFCREKYWEMPYTLNLISALDKWLCNDGAINLRGRCLACTHTSPLKRNVLTFKAPCVCKEFPNSADSLPVIS
jgi:hypothetical protein